MENQRNTYDLLNSINGFIIDVKFLTVSSNMAFVARNVTENYINISRLPMGILFITHNSLNCYKQLELLRYNGMGNYVYVDCKT